MLPFNQIRIGNLLRVEYKHRICEGEVVDLNRDEQQICVDTGVQEFWFDSKDVFPIPLNDAELLKLNFAKQVYADTGEVKYSKDAFRLIIPSADDFSNIEMWYREDRRHHPDVHSIHQLQNFYREMTKMHLSKELV